MKQHDAAEQLKLHRADYGPEETAAITEAIESGWLTRGPRTRQFEQDFGSRVGAGHCLGTNSCTAALHLALLCGGVGPGDEVIIPALTFAATANVVVHCGATPVFADVLEASHTIDPGHVEQLVSPATRAIIPVHFAGIPCELDELSRIALDNGLFIVEDCAHAIESEYKSRPAGVAGSPATRFAAYSFYATKNLICGEGGMLACRDAADLEQATVLGLHGMSADAWKRYGGDSFRLYDIVAAGYKYNMFDLQAALGLVQLGKLDTNHQRRKRLVEHYDELIGTVEGVSGLGYPSHTKPAHHLYVIRLDPEYIEKFRQRTAGPSIDQMPHASLPRDAVITGLRRRGVEAYLHYICLNETRFYRGLNPSGSATTPVAAELARRSITLPLYPDMKAEDVERVTAAVSESLAEVLEG